MVRLTDDQISSLARSYAADPEMSSLIADLVERRQDDHNLVNRRQQNVIGFSMLIRAEARP